MKIQDQNKSQRNELIYTLLLSMSAQKLDAIKAKLLFQKMWGIDEDWHEYSYALDHLHRQGKIELVGHGRDGMCIYQINGDGEV